MRMYQRTEVWRWAQGDFARGHGDRVLLGVTDLMIERGQDAQWARPK